MNLEQKVFVMSICGKVIFDLLLDLTCNFNLDLSVSQYEVSVLYIYSSKILTKVKVAANRQTNMICPLSSVPGHEKFTLACSTG